MASAASAASALRFLFLLSFHAFFSMASDELGFHSFVLMWPGSYCKKSSAGCCLPKNGQPELDFFVEGLFPYSKDATPLTNCNESPFNLGQISDIEEDLTRYWSNIKCPSSEGKLLWENLWNTYGVCTGLSQKDYFKKALALRSKIGLLSLLEKNGIISTDYADYSFSELKKVVTSGIGANAAIECSKNAWEESIVYKVYMCVDKEVEAIIPCPVLPDETSCASRVVLGAFTYDMLKNETAASTNPIKMRFHPW